MDLRSIVSHHAATSAENEAARIAMESKRKEDAANLIRIHADKIEECLKSVVQPVLEDGIQQLGGSYRAALKIGHTNDPRLFSKQTVLVPVRCMEILKEGFPHAGLAERQ